MTRASSADVSVRAANLKIVAEIPVISERENTLMRRTFADRKEIKAFWWADPKQKARVFQVFREAGARAIVIDRLPLGVDTSSWRPVLPKNVNHISSTGAQWETYKDMAVMWLSRKN